jgi:hypothetical protein
LLAGGGAFGIGHVCWSVIRHEGFPPMITVGQAGPNSGEPWLVESPKRAAGLPISISLIDLHEASLDCVNTACLARDHGSLVFDSRAAFDFDFYSLNLDRAVGLHDDL